MLETTCRFGVYCRWHSCRARRTLYTNGIRSYQYKNMGRYRRHLSFVCYGIRILFQEVDDRRRYSCYRLYNHSLRNDVSRLYCRKRAWLLASKQYIFRRYAFYVIHRYRIQGVRWHGTQRAKIYRSSIRRLGGRRFSGRSFDGLAFTLSSQQASRRNGNAGKYSKVRSVSYILVITRNLSDSKFS